MSTQQKMAEAAAAMAEARKSLMAARRDMDHARWLLEEVALAEEGGTTAVSVSSDSGSIWAFARGVDATALELGRMSKRLAPKKRAP